MVGVALGEWIPLRRLTVSDLPRLGAVSAAYALRDFETHEVLYIGMTTSLRMRLFGNYVGGVGGDTTHRVHWLLFEEGFVERAEVAWVITDRPGEAEAALKAAHRAANGGRLPRWTLR